MLKIRVFLNDPCGLTWKNLHEILPRLEQKYEISLETLTKSRDEYHTKEYQASGLPAAPAVMVEDEIAAQGRGISEEQVDAVIRRHLGLPELPPEPKKGILERLFKK